MKKTYSICSFLFLLFVLSCSKKEAFYNELGQGAYLTLVKTNNTNLNSTDANSTVSQVVKEYGVPVESVNLYVSTTSTTDKTKWKLIKNLPYASGSELTLSATTTEIAKALGITQAQIQPGSIYYLYNEVVTKDGRKFSMANTNSPDLENQLGFNVALRWQATVVCPYNPATIAGSYEVVTDLPWHDWDPGAIVQVTGGPGVNDVNLSQVWPNPAFGDVVNPFTITVNPATGQATIPSGVTIGDYGAYKLVTGTGSTGFVFSCTGVITIRVRLTATGFGDQGFNQLTLKKI